MTTRTVLALFDTREDVESAIDHLDLEGFKSKDISIIMKDYRGGVKEVDSTGSDVAGGAATGATTGAVIGGLAGLLVGVGALAIPGIGGLLIGGPLAAALGLTGAAATTVTGAATGAVAGGLLGALMGLGLPRETAQVYENRIKEGAILLAVPIRDEYEDEVRDILEADGANEIKSVTMPRERVSQEVEEDYPRRRSSAYSFGAMGAKGGRTRTRRRRRN